MGGHATKDLDVWVEASAENAPKVIEGLIEFGPAADGSHRGRSKDVREC